MPRFRVDSTNPPTSVDNWKPINLMATESDDATKEARKAAERALSEVLQCDQVLILTGLGTSLCIKRADSTPLFPTMGVLWEKVLQEVGAKPFKKVQEAVGFTTGTNIEELLSRCQMNLALKPVTPPPADIPASSTEVSISDFVKKAEKVIRTECRQSLDSKTTEVHQDFLRRLTRRAPRRPRANLFTTNYDLCFESAAAYIGLPIIDGFSFSVPPHFQPEVFDYDIVTNSSYSKEPDFVPSLLRLFKLHGSVDWHQHEGVVTKKADTDTPILIYPQSGKYASSYTPPFLEIMSRFQWLLRQRNIGVITVCCGLNDLHIAEPLLSAVKTNSSLRMIVCAPDLCETDAKKLYGADAVGAIASNAVLRQLDHLSEHGDSRITFINGLFQDIVRLMPMLALQTDAEQHEARIKKLEASVTALKNNPTGGV